MYDPSVVEHRVAVFVLVLLPLVSCTSSPKPEPSTTLTFQRYFFDAPNDRGVLEVSTADPSICYSTQSYPSRPIVIVATNDGAAHPVATYEPKGGEFCDRHVNPDIERRLIDHPESFLIRWSPQEGEPVVGSSLVAQEDA
jgi:hypothetical protein